MKIWDAFTFTCVESNDAAHCNLWWKIPNITSNKKKLLSETQLHAILSTCICRPKHIWTEKFGMMSRISVR